MAITKFKGAYGFLSNFWPVEVTYLGDTYPSVEHAYQAAKAKDDDWVNRAAIKRAATAADAKKLGKVIALRDDWDDVRESIMRDSVHQKFSRQQLKDKLLATGDQELIEGNWWGDTFWGVCKGVGLNVLGTILMQERASWQ